MSREISRQAEQYLASVVASGLFPSEEAAIVARREKIAPISALPDEHTEVLEQGMASLRARRCRDLDDADWESLRQLARDSASSGQPGSH